jgi:chromosome segregation ATPase
LVRAELVKIFVPFGQPPVPGQDLCAWALETLHGHEIERRIEIERFRSNRPKFEAKIDRLRQAKPKSRKELPDLERQQKLLRKCCVEVAHKRRQLKSVRIENESIAGECDRRAHEANKTARRLRLLSENKRETQKTLSEQRSRKGELESARKKVADGIQTTKMTQRFGPLAKSPVHKSRVDLILSLRREVGELRRVGEELATKKKLLMIENVRDSQRFVVRPRTGIDP